MSVERIASRYAKSLVELSIEKDQLEAVRKDLELFRTVSQDKDFSLMLNSPVIKGDTKGKVFKALFDGKISQITSAFFDIIVRKGREIYLPAISQEFENQYRAHKKISTVKLTTATAVGQDSIDLILKELNASPKTRDSIQMETKVDPSLIGGFILEFGDKLYDTSVKSKLGELRKEFKKNEYIKNM